MKISYDLAQLIVNQTIDLLGRNVSVADENGIIISSGDSQRVGTFCGTAAQALETGEATEVWAEAGDEDNHQEGISLPLKYDGQQVGVIVVNDAPERARSATRVVQALAELMIHQTTVIEQLPLQKELRDKFIADLLHGRAGDEDAVFRQAQVLGMDLTVPRVVILVDASHFVMDEEASNSQALERQLRIRRNKHRVVQVVVDFFHLPTDAICGYVGGGCIAILKSVGGQDPPSWGDLTAFKRTANALLLSLKRETNAQISLGLGRYHPGTAGLAQSYEDAAAALDLGCRLVGADRVHCLDGLGIAALIAPANQQTKVELAIHLLKPVDDQADLLQTLGVFFAQDCALGATSERLFIHRNTLSYRLDKIQSLTGLDPRRFDQAVQLRLALLLRSLA